MTNQELFTIFRNLTIFFAAAMLVKYFVFLVMAAFFPVGVQLRRRRIFKREIKHLGYIRRYTPGISVIVPAWNESAGVIKTIESVLANSYPNVEVIVINDGSTDGSRELVDNYIRKYNLAHLADSTGRTLRQYYQPRGGKGRRSIMA